MTKLILDAIFLALNPMLSQLPGRPILQTCKQNHLTWALCFARFASFHSLNSKSSQNPLTSCFLPLSGKHPHKKVQRKRQAGEEKLKKGSRLFMFYLSLDVSLLKPGLNPVCLGCADHSINSHLSRTWSATQVLIILFYLRINSRLGEPGRS